MFSLDRQALAFLAVIALVAISMVFLAPFVLFALGGLGVLLIVATWLKAAIRARKVLAPFGPIEGALALSSLLLVIGAATVTGFWVARLGLGTAVEVGGMMIPFLGSGPKPGARSVSYGNAEMQQGLKDGLTKAGIPFRTRMEGGKEFVSWDHEHDDAAQKVQDSLHARPSPARSVSYSDPATQQRLKDEFTRAGIPFTTSTSDGKEYIGWSREHDAAADRIQETLHGPRGVHFGTAQFQKEFIAWLAKRKIKSAIVEHEGKEYVTWDDPRQPKEMMDAFIAEQPRSKCGPDKAKPKAKC
jgi:hypothetical protein